MILDVIFIGNSVRVAGEMFCVFNHVAVLLIWLGFFCFVLVWFGFFVCFGFFYGKKMSLACFYSQIDFACGCPDADEL